MGEQIILGYLVRRYIPKIKGGCQNYCDTGGLTLGGHPAGDEAILTLLQ